MLRIEKPGRFIAFLIFLAILLGLAIFSISNLVWGTTALQQSGELVIAEGSTAGRIWQQLVDQGFTARTTPWRYHAWRLDAGSKIQSGTYQLQAGETVEAVVRRLISGDTTLNEITITYPEGFTLQQMAQRTASNRLGTVDEFIQNAQPSAITDDFSFLAAIPAGRDLEGYLFPDTYRFSIDDTAPDVIQRMVATFARRFSPELRAAADRQDRTIDQIVIMASIIEREVQTDADMAQVAGILWSRFDDGVGLGADATVRYALNKWDTPLTVQDLDSDSPYNTRKFRGLPPGPISNPGLRALTAAANPVPTDFYYYLSTPEGETIFSRTLEEHNTNKTRYLR